MPSSYHTETFNNIPAEKRERILRVAAEALGRDGISGTRMADIAKAAGISHGSLFSYFPTKDHLVRAVVARGATMEGERLDMNTEGSIASILEHALKSAWETASDEPNLISLWLSLSLSENARFSDDVLPLERDAADKWLALVRSAQESGAIKADPRVVAFILDAAVSQLMKSRATELERKKFDFFFEGVDDPARLIALTLVKLLGIS